MPRMIRATLIPALLLLLALTAPSVAQEQGAVVPMVEIAQEERGLWDRWRDFLVDFQRRANAEVATHMNAIQRGDDLGAFFLGLGIAFLYGIVHAFGPGHGKFIVMSYFVGRDANVARGVWMSVQIAVVHVIAAVVLVWLADVILRSSAGIGLGDVPGVRAASFLIIAAIGLYMLYQATRAALGYIDPAMALHGHSHSGGGHGHGHGHGHDNGHEHGHSHADEPSHSHSHGHSHAEAAVPQTAQSHAHSHGESPSPSPSHSESHGHSHAHSHGHSHADGHRHAASKSAASGISEASRTESRLVAFAAGIVPCPGAVLIMLYAVANNMIYPGFLLVGAMSIGIGLTICLLGVGAILARQTATRMLEAGGGGGAGVVLVRHAMNFGGAIIVTLIGLVSFVAFLDLPGSGF